VNKIDLPKEFVAFKELSFCSNTLQNCKIPIIIDDTPILLVGKGEQPQIWISAIVNQETNKVGPVVIANFIRIATADLNVEAKNDSTCIKFKDTVIIKATKLSDEKAEIKQIDMRPFGFNIYGDSSTLNVGANVMSGNNIAGARAFIALSL